MTTAPTSAQPDSNGSDTRRSWFCWQRKVAASVFFIAVVVVALVALWELHQ